MATIKFNRQWHGYVQGEITDAVPHDVAARLVRFGVARYGDGPVLPIPPEDTVKVITMATAPTPPEPAPPEKKKPTRKSRVKKG